MTAGHRPLMPGDSFSIRITGKEHTVGDLDCPGCEVMDGIRYPHPHHEGGTIVHLQFLVHGEAFQDVFAQCCEGGCSVPSIKFAPPLPGKRSE